VVSLDLINSITVAGTSEVTSAEEFGIGNGKTAGTSARIFHAADAMETSTDSYLHWALSS